MANRWTKEQKQAIDARGSDLLIAAAAGSGKTAVLVERIITKLLREGQEIDRLLVVTFTNAAASEMRLQTLCSHVLEISHGFRILVRFLQSEDYQHHLHKQLRADFP